MPFSTTGVAGGEYGVVSRFLLSEGPVSIRPAWMAIEAKSKCGRSGRKRPYFLPGRPTIPFSITSDSLIGPPPHAENAKAFRWKFHHSGRVAILAPRYCQSSLNAKPVPAELPFLARRLRPRQSSFPLQLRFALENGAQIPPHKVPICLIAGGEICVANIPPRV